MSLFLDCEFNGHNGKLISMALVSNLSDEEFYEVLHLPHNEKIDPWVLTNVIPVLNKPAIAEEEFKSKLHTFLLKHMGEPIFADSPADFRYLLNYWDWMNENRYRYLSMEAIFMFVIPDRKKYWPENPLEHNALSDAKTLLKWQDWYMDSRTKRNSTGGEE